MSIKDTPTAFSTARSRRLRFGAAPAGADQTLRDRSTRLANELDQIAAARKAGDTSPSEARQQSQAAIRSYKAAVESMVATNANARRAVLAAGDAVQERVQQRLAKLTGYELLRVQRRAAAIESNLTELFDVAQAIERKDHEGLLAASLLDPSLGNRALAALFANAETNALVAAAPKLQALAAAEAAVAAAAELESLDDPWADRHVGTSRDIATDIAPPLSTLAPETWPKWLGEFMNVEPPAPPAPMPAEARQTAEGAA